MAFGLGLRAYGPHPKYLIMCEKGEVAWEMLCIVYSIGPSFLAGFKV